MYSTKVEVYILYINNKMRILLTVKQTLFPLTKCVLAKNIDIPKTELEYMTLECTVAQIETHEINAQKICLIFA